MRAIGQGTGFSWKQASYIEGELGELAFLLDAACDVAQAGIQHAGGTEVEVCVRFDTIDSLLVTYRKLLRELIAEGIYPKKTGTEG